MNSHYSYNYTQKDIDYFLFKGNPDLPAWQRYFFDVSDGAMHIDFYTLRNYIKYTKYETVSFMT